MNNEQVVKLIDYWLKSSQESGLSPRDVLNHIDYDTKEIVDLIGPRRSGKSSALKLIIRRLKLTDTYLFINFEDPFFIEHNQPDIIDTIISVFRAHFNSRLTHIFFDEVQEIHQWEKALRKIRDGEDMKLFITGSSSKLLSSEISSSLTGRHLSYDVLPLSFKEFLQFKGLASLDLKEAILKETMLKKLWEDYLVHGGFPAVVLSGQRELLKTYFSDIIQKDIITRHAIRDQEALWRMAVYLYSNAAKIVSKESLKKAFQLSFDAVSTYLAYLQEAFLIFEVPQFSYSLKTQQKSMKKMYAIDTGLASAAAFKFSADQGRMLENAVFLELIRRKKEVYYYQTNNGREVDFLTRQDDRHDQLIQICWDMSDAVTRQREVRSLREAMDELQMESGVILTNNAQETIVEGGKTITVIPAYVWALGLSA